MFDFLSSDESRYLALTLVYLVAIIAGCVFVKHFTTDKER